MRYTLIRLTADKAEAAISGVESAGSLEPSPTKSSSELVSSSLPVPPSEAATTSLTISATTSATASWVNFYGILCGIYYACVGSL